MNAVRLFSLILLLAVSVFCVACKTGSSKIAPNSKLPDFSLEDIHGVMHKNSDYQGKKLIINFWASWCPPCIEEMPGLQKLYSELKEQGFELIAIAVDDQKEAVRKFQQQFQLTFPILLDKEAIVRDRFQVKGFPETLFSNSKGLVQLVKDPDTGYPEIRFIGPRDWMNPGLKLELLKIN